MKPLARHVFVVSFDGGKPAVMRESHMPTLERMVRDGAHTWQARTVLPSITLVSHTAMLTGVGPAKHKVDWNDWKPEKGVVGVPTSFALVKKFDKTLVTGLFAGKEKFAHLFQPGSLNAFSVPGYYAQTVAEAAAPFVRREKPNLCFIHFSDPDGAGHSKGWGSLAQKQALTDCDRALKSLLQAIEHSGVTDSSVVILSADHGGHARTHGQSGDDDMHIPWIVWGAGVRPGVEITAPVTTYDTAATALWLLGVPLPTSFDGRPVESAFDFLQGGT